MKNLLVILCLLLMASPAISASEVYTGHSIRGMSEFTGDEVTGFLTDVGPVRLGAGRFSATHYVHALLEGYKGPLFAGVGIGWVDEHRSLDGPIQFTLTGGAKYRISAEHELVFRWWHISNGANFFQHGDESAKQANKGIDFFTVGITF